MVQPVPTQGLSPNFPIHIPSEHESRIVGCSCEHDFSEVIWFKLERSKGGGILTLGNIFVLLIAHLLR